MVNFFFLAADQSRMMQEQMSMQAGGVQDPKQVRCINKPQKVQRL